MNDHPESPSEGELPSVAPGPAREPDAGGEGDPVGAAVDAYLDFLEGVGPPPSLAGLTAPERRETEGLFAVMEAGRGVDPHCSTPSVEELLAGTELEESLTASGTGYAHPGASELPDGDSRIGDRNIAWAERIKRALCASDDRVVVTVRPHPHVGPAVTATYLDLTTVFVTVGSGEPPPVDAIRARVESIFRTDPDIDYVGVVAGDSLDLLTQMASCADLGPTAVVPSDRDGLIWPAVLPLTDAFHRTMELAAPLWEPFTLNISDRGPLPLRSVADRAASQVITRECSRAFHGDKGRAYKSFARAAPQLSELILALGAGRVDDNDVTVALDRLLRETA